MGVSASRAGMQPPLGPPSCTALNSRPCLMPPPISSTTSRIVIPMGTSIRPPRWIFPASANTFVPRLVLVPNAANALAPWRRIHGTQASVSTLLMMVGLPRKPGSTGYGGRSLGMPRLPSRDWISAVSSPHTKAPAPSRTSSCNAPSNPRSSACWMAARVCLTASGYSARMYRYPWVAPTACAAMAKPSSTRCGSLSSTRRSMNAPGSPSSPLQMTYFTGSALARPTFHLVPVGKPHILSAEEMDPLGKTTKWAMANAHPLLDNSTIVLGDPAKREPYGYVHSSAEKSIVMLRNPFVEPRTVRLKIDEESGFRKVEGAQALEIQYPYRRVVAAVKFGDTVTFEIGRASCRDR